MFEESSTERGGCADSAPMTFHNLMIMLEKKGVFDAKVTGHNVSRPPSVQRGEESDRQVLMNSFFLRTSYGSCCMLAGPSGWTSLTKPFRCTNQILYLLSS